MPAGPEEERQAAAAPGAARPGGPQPRERLSPPQEGRAVVEGGRRVGPGGGFLAGLRAQLDHVVLEAVAAPAIGADPLRAAAVADGAPRRAHGPGQGVGGDGLARPEPLEQLLVGHDAVPLLDQQGQERQGLGLDRHHLTAPAELAGRVVELAVAEAIDHANLSSLQQESGPPRW